MVGAPFNYDDGVNSGNTFMYSIDDSGWTKVTDLAGEAAGDRSFEAVAIAGDGSRIAIGAPRNDEGWEDSGHVIIIGDVNEKYPSCNPANSTNLSKIGDGSCDVSLNVHECGYDDGDCDWRNNGDYSQCKLESDEVNNGVCDFGNDGNDLFDIIHCRCKNLLVDIDGLNQNEEIGYSVALSFDGSYVAFGGKGIVRMQSLLWVIMNLMIMMARLSCLWIKDPPLSLRKSATLRRGWRN